MLRESLREIDARGTQALEHSLARYVRPRLAAPVAPPHRVRWAVVLVPPLIVAVLALLTDTVLDEILPVPWSAVTVALAVLIIGIVVATATFGRIDALSLALQAQNKELEARGASANALNRVSVATASLSDVDDVLDAVVVYACELLGADVAVLLLEGADGRLELRAASGPPGAILAPAGLAATAAAAPRVGTGGDAAGPLPADAILPFVDPARAVVRLSAPLQRGGQTIGLLAIGGATVRGFDADEVETLASLANQATIALEHARLEDRLRELAVVEERERIARELHDGIAQVLGYVNTKSQAIDGHLAHGHVDEARVQVAQLGAAARAVYVDVREAILGLRSPIEPGQGLGAAAQAYAQRVAADAPFALDLDITDEIRDLRLDAEAEAQVYRIVQEALTNVRKHASARRVRMSMVVVGDQLHVRIDDDGRGFGPGATTGDVARYGLRSMHERAAAIGATLDVRPGWRGGVVVVLRLPLAAHLRRAGATVGAGS
jgi:signal transduction histidine kinase